MATDREAFLRCVAREEKREAFRKEALEPWETYPMTGLHANAEEADRWLSELE